MKLNELVSFRERLKTTLTSDGVVDSIDVLCRDLMLLVDHSLDEGLRHQVKSIVLDLKSISGEVERVVDRRDIILSDVEKDISNITKKFFAANYDTEFEYNDPEVIRKTRKLYIPKHAVPVLESKLGSIIDWKYPALEIGCRDIAMTKNLIAADPFYLADVHQSFLDTTVQNFNKEYQRRIRPYLVKDQDFSSLPQEQFGFVFSWNYFNYLSLDSVKHHLAQIFDLLRPGGQMLFSYNNGDLPDAAGYAERYYMTYMPKSMLAPMCEMLGYEVIDSQDFQPAVSWLQIKKPGTLRTVKSHQVFGAILDKNSNQ